MTASSPVAASSELFRRDDDNGVVTLTLNTPHNLNALSLAMIEALIVELDAIANDETARIVVAGRRRTGAQRRPRPSRKCRRIATIAIEAAATTWNCSRAARP